MTVDVGIEDADPTPRGGKCFGEVDRDGRLPDATLTRGDRNHLGQRIRPGERNLAFRLSALEQLPECHALLIGHHPQLDLDCGHSRHGEYCGGHVAVERVTHRASSDGQQDPYVYPTCDVHLDTVNHPEVGDGPPNLRIIHPMECHADLGHQRMFSGRSCGGSVGLRVLHVPSVGEIVYRPSRRSAHARAPRDFRCLIARSARRNRARNAQNSNHTAGCKELARFPTLAAVF